MALTKPLLNTITAFDVHVGNRFTFSVIGGDQVIGCKLSIFDNDTDELVYVDEQLHEGYYFDLPADPDYNNDLTIDLENGGNYNAYIQTKNSSGEYSIASSRIQFYCFATPTFTFTVDTAIVSSATNTWHLNYDVNETYPSEPIDTLVTYGFILYNSDGSQAQTSNTLYTAVRPELDYTFFGLLNGNTYKI